MGYYLWGSSHLVPLGTEVTSVLVENATTMAELCALLAYNKPEGNLKPYSKLFYLQFEGILEI